MRKHMQTHEKPMVAANGDGFIEPPITDNFGRVFDYLRLAVNDQCNLRCIYCMPEKGIPFLDQDKLLDTKDVKRLINIFSSLGVSKIRFTGGEPLLRRDILELIEYSSDLPDIDTVHMTTNGVLLPSYLDQLERVGLSGLNISLDTLRPDRFKSITRRDHFQDPPSAQLSRHHARRPHLLADHTLARDGPHADGKGVRECAHLR